MAKAKKTESEIIQGSIELKMQELVAHVLGVTPFVCNRMSQKGIEALLYPKGRKTAAEKATSLKHDPMSEYRDSPYTTADPAAPTLIMTPAVSFKRAVESVALDVPGATKSQISRNIVAPETRISLFGVPQMFMAVVRSADMAKTPDVRTRAIIPQWACTVRLRYPYPLFREKVIADYLALAGQLRGVGDYRPERGAGSYGTFEVVSPDDPRYQAVIKGGGRQAQAQALAAPEYYDDETETLINWFEDERVRRGASNVKAKNGNGHSVHVEEEMSE